MPGTHSEEFLTCYNSVHITFITASHDEADSLPTSLLAICLKQNHKSYKILTNQQIQCNFIWSDASWNEKSVFLSANSDNSVSVNLHRLQFCALSWLVLQTFLICLICLNFVFKFNFVQSHDFCCKLKKIPAHVNLHLYQFFAVSWFFDV